MYMTFPGMENTILKFHDFYCTNPELCVCVCHYVVKSYVCVHVLTLSCMHVMVRMYCMYYVFANMCVFWVCVLVSVPCVCVCVPCCVRRRMCVQWYPGTRRPIGWRLSSLSFRVQRCQNGAWWMTRHSAAGRAVPKWTAPSTAAATQDSTWVGPPTAVSARVRLLTC